MPAKLILTLFDVCRADCHLSSHDLEDLGAADRQRITCKRHTASIVWHTALHPIACALQGLPGEWKNSTPCKPCLQVVVVLSGSMEPGFYRGDILFLNLGTAPIRVGEVVVFNIDGRDVPIVHRVVKVHERLPGGEIDILTKVGCLLVCPSALCQIR